MPKHEIDNDPAFDMSEQAKALAADRNLRRIFDEIVTAEADREAASKKIKTLWLLVAKEGFDVADARKRFVRHTCGG